MAVFVELLQQLVALVQCFLVLQQVVEIAFVGLRYDPVDELAPEVAAAHDDVLVLRRNNHQRYFPYVFSKSLIGLFVPPHLLCLTFFLDAGHRYHVLPYLVVAMDGKEFLSAADVLAVDRIEKALAERQVVDGIQQVGLSDPVVAHQTVDVGTEVHIQFGIGLEIVQFEIRQVHSSV